MTTTVQMVTFLGTLLLSGPIGAQEAETNEPGSATAAVESEPEPQASASPEESESVPLKISAGRILEKADSALEEGHVEQARTFYIKIIEEHSGVPEVKAAQRALKIMDVTRAPKALTSDKNIRANDDDKFFRLEPYSHRTSERLRLSWWEKFDFGVTSFTYGLSVGLSYGLAIDPDDRSEAMFPVALGASAYTVLSVLYLNAGQPERGDLPLALAIASYIPTTALLASNLKTNWRDEKKKALIVGLAGTLAVPAAVIAARHYDLDPGDAQLARDAGFWGLVLGVTGALGFGGDSDCFEGYCYEKEPSNKSVSMAGLLGLYGGLGLGIAGALNSEVSLERIRATTWGGYGGLVLGGLIGATAKDVDQGTYRGMAIGGAAGLLVTFFATPAIDKIPDDGEFVHEGVASTLAPAMIPVTDRRGRVNMAWGVSANTEIFGRLWQPIHGGRR